MGTFVKVPADFTGARIFKKDTYNAKRERKEMGLRGYRVKASAELTEADSFKEDTSKAKREKTETCFHEYPRKSPR